MFPRPIQQTSPATQWLYKLALPVALVLWLFPLLGVAITSVRPASDLAQGNYFGMPSYFAFENYADVFRNTPMARYILNSFVVTIPTVIGAVALSLMTGGRVDPGRPAPRADVLPDAEALHRGPYPWSREMTKIAFIGRGPPCS